MQRAIAFLSVAAVLFFAGAAFSAADLESAQYAGHVYVDAQTGNVTWGAPGGAPAAGVDIYSNTGSAANAAISSTSLTSIWGDHVVTTANGILSAMDFTIFNSGSSAGPLLTATVGIGIYDFNTSASIGGYSTSINFGSGLAAGFYTIITVTNIDPLAINLNVADLLVLQQVTAKTGTASRLGVASLDPVTTGSSPVTMYINSSTIGAAGYYQLSSGGVGVNSNPGYRINANAPVPTEPSTWGKVKSLYR